MKIAVCLAVLLTFTAPISASAFVPSAPSLIEGPHSQPAAGKKKPVIDKSCLMICEKWTDDGCSKWVMKCKGDPGYPKGILLRQ